jgi:hypothetical protein
MVGKPTTPAGKPHPTAGATETRIASFGVKAFATEVTIASEHGWIVQGNTAISGLYVIGRWIQLNTNRCTKSSSTGIVASVTLLPIMGQKA